jgi:hypothetical protein
VAGEICEGALNPDAWLELAEVGAGLDISNGSVELWPKPVDCDEDDADEVSDLMASTAAEAAPKANSMAELRQMPHGAAHFHAA